MPTSPAVHVPRPRLDYESHATGLDRNEVGALLVPAGLGAPSEHALISLLALNALRASEAIGANIESFGLERGHRALIVLRKGGKIVTSLWPLARRERSTLPSANALAGRSSSAPMVDASSVTRQGASCGVWPAVPGSTDRASHFATRLRHRCTRCWSAVTRCTRGCLVR